MLFVTVAVAIAVAAAAAGTGTGAGAAAGTIAAVAVGIAAAAARGGEQKDGVSPDIVTYNTCVTIAGQAGRLDQALELLRRASEEGGLELDVVSYRAALGGLRREKRWEAAVKLLGDMRRRGLEPDEVKSNMKLEVFFCFCFLYVLI